MKPVTQPRLARNSEHIFQQEDAMNQSINRHWFLTVSLAVLMTGSCSMEQERSEGDGGGAVDSSPQRPRPRLHLEKGDTLPDVKLYTGEGEEFRTTQLKGSHTVLVFGCLTPLCQ